jgi:hypothetical protein
MDHLELCGSLRPDIYIIYERTPPYTFEPFCTYDLTHRLNVTIEAAGKQYSSEVVTQLSRSRNWVAVMNSGGCQQTHGTALSFRLADDRLVLISSRICPKAERAFADTVDAYYARDFARAMNERRKIDLTSFCIGVGRDRGRSGFDLPGYEGFLVDSADTPTQWMGFRFDYNASTYSDQHLRMVSAAAEAADISPEDKLDRVAPAVLKTEFNTGGTALSAFFHSRADIETRNSSTLPTSTCSKVICRIGGSSPRRLEERLDARAMG